MKRCSACCEEKALADFYADPRATDGLYSRCKVCHCSATARSRSEHNDDRAKALKRVRAKRYYARGGKENVQKHARRRKARLRGAAHAEHVDSLVVLELADGACGICGEDVDPFDFHVDHITPLSQGGLHNLVNTQPAHPLCNRQKYASVQED